jgi:S-DNA-T family DNA segregation ATPase FtsK/SpoIIIE
MSSTKRNVQPKPPVAARVGDDFLKARRQREIGALFCAGVAVLYFFALISYTPHDLPSWVPFSRPLGPEHRVVNLVGPVGALSAGAAYHLFGAAVYFIPVMLLWFSFATVAGFAVWRGRTILAAAAFLISASCLIDLQPVFLRDWVLKYNLPHSPGGAAGHLIGHELTGRYLGPLGSSAVMLVLYLCGLLGLTGFRPIRFGRAYVPDLADCIHHPMVDGCQPSPIVPNAVAYPQLPDFQHGAMAPVRSIRVIEVESDPDDIVQLGAGSIPEYDGHPSAAIPKRFPSPMIRVEETDPGADDGDLALPPHEWDEAVAYGGGGKERRPESVLAKARHAELDDDSGDMDLDSVEDAVPIREVVRPVPQIIDTARTRRTRREVRPVLADPANVPGSFYRQGGTFHGYELPSIDLLDYEEEKHAAEVADTSVLVETQRVIIDTLRTFGLIVSPGDITRGPTITRYEIYPSVGQSVKKIAALEADIARATRAERINILAPIPGRDTVGIEIANHKKVLVPLRELLEDKRFTDGKAQIPLALGKDVYGNPLVADLAAMPHLLVAGATGSGKSVCINSIIVSLLCRFTPEELRFIMIDPKVVEMQMYKDLPHLAVPVVTSPKKVLLALRWCINEMERRYELFAEAGCRKLEEYNNRHVRQQQRRARRAAALQPELFPRDEIGGRGSIVHPPVSDPSADEAGDEDMHSKLPFIVVIIDELADLMQTAPAEVETAISRLCQKARASGIHLIVATQSPRVDVVTGLIKANIPSRIAFQVASATDSRVILDRAGADRLVGKGDMLYQPPDSPVLVRAQGAFVTDDEVQDIVEHCAAQSAPVFDRSIQDNLDTENDEEAEAAMSDADEEILDKCIEVILAERKASTSFLQRRLRLGYTRAARMMDILQERGIVGPGDGAKPREILIAPDPDLG